MLILREERLGDKTNKPKQCKAHLKKDPTRRCSKNALPGGDLCRAHHNRCSRPVTGLTSIYQVGMFADLIKDLPPSAVDNIKDLSGEVVLLRATLNGILKLCSQEAGSADEQATALMTMAPVVQTMADTISKVVDKMERIENGLKISLNARQVAMLANQIVHIVNEEVDDPVVRQRVSERIANMVVAE